MALLPRTKVRRPNLAGTPSADRVGWIAPPGHYPVELDGDFLTPDGEPNTKTTERRDPPDESGNWIVVWWQGRELADGTRGSGIYRWEYVPWLEVLTEHTPESPGA
ncbi:hypothetical protein AB0L82_43355 [Nocardia sp. NPDC052001]|uniref:hypothetical protein n=1 Tax=Nocardia sp. NPDC052001 TaxID=3154853 RepID=UPI00342BDA9A